MSLPTLPKTLLLLALAPWAAGSASQALAPDKAADKLREKPWTNWTANLGDCDQDGIKDAIEIANGSEADCDLDGIPDDCQMASRPSADLDGNGQLDSCQWLSADVAEVSLELGGKQTFFLHADEDRAGDLFLLLGSVSGSRPGVPLRSTFGSFTLPLVVDGYLAFTLEEHASPLLDNTFGALDSYATAHASAKLPAGSSPSLVGVTAYHAFVTIDPPTLQLTGVSNPVRVSLVP